MTILDELMSPKEFDAWLKSIPPAPSIEEAKAILESSEIINPGTENEFVKGCFSNKYRDAVMVLESEFCEIKKLLEEKG